MSARLQSRPLPQPRVPAVPSPVEPPAGPPFVPSGGGERLLIPLVALLAAAILPLGRVFVGWDFLRPVMAAVLITVGLSWGCRRFHAGPTFALAVSALGWAMFVTAAFLGGTTLLGVVPTPASVEAFRELWAHGFEVIATRPAPVFAEPSLLLLTVTGIWALTHAVDGIVFRLSSPLKAILPALGLWLVPVLLTLGDGSPAAWTVPFLAAAALLAFVATSADVHRWSGEAGSPHAQASTSALGALVGPGVLIAGTAIGLGVLLAATLPGFEEPPWYELGGVGGTTLTTNPIVSIRPSLVATGKEPVMHVTTERPVYLRTTSLDVYSDTGEWTNAGIRGTPIPGDGGDMRAEPTPVAARTLDVEVEVKDLPGAVLVPAPYQPRAVTGEAAAGFQFDPRLATLTTRRGATLEPGDRYRVFAAVPDPHPDAIRGLHAPPRPEQVALPDNVPGEVVALARDIVEEAGARTPFEQALAIQEEFQSGRWTYSLDPPQGHSGDAMLAFITNRIGYCEQYAGTMAVMLRALDVPARVAVGFTPGERIAEDTYEVSNGNAHAWVEVLFPGQGWLAFEPTPRDDGNVLAPSADDLAPELTLQQQAAAEPLQVPETEPDSAVAPEELLVPPAAQDSGPAAAGPPEDDAGGGRRLIGLLLALAAVGGAASLVHTRRRAAAPSTPLERILHARHQVGTLGRGLGMSAVAWETDREYLQRLSTATRASQAPAAAVALADRVAQARYAPQLPVAAAEEAEAAAGSLRAFLLDGRSAPARAAVLLRGAASAAAARVTAPVRAAARRVRRR